MNSKKIDKFLDELRTIEIVDTKNWKEFELGDLFKCNTAKQVLKVENGNFPYITRSAFNNGLTKFVNRISNKINDGNCITIGAEGFFAFYQEEEFMAGNKIYVLRHKKLNKFNGLFICSILNSIVNTYSYSDARILEKIRNEKHNLPVDKNGEPDWEYMEKYIKYIYKNIEKTLK